MVEISEMKTMQIRLTKSMLKEIDSTIDKGVYSNRCEAVRNLVALGLKFWREEQRRLE